MKRLVMYLLCILFIAALLTGCNDTPMSTPAANLTASPTSVTLGRSVTLTWSSQNATSVVSSNFGAQGTSGSMTVTPLTTTNYILTVGNLQGQATSSVSVLVSM